MALQWTGSNTPVFVATRPVRAGATKQRDNFTLAEIAFTVEFTYDPDTPPAPSDEEVLGWLQPMYDAMTAAGWTFHTLTQDAPPAVRTIQEA
jgi:hypothetical protein